MTSIVVQGPHGGLWPNARHREEACSGTVKYEDNGDDDGDFGDDDDDYYNHSQLTISDFTRRKETTTNLYL